MDKPERPAKKDAFLALLREGWTSLHLDARRSGVELPAHLKGEPHLVLQYGYDLPIPIPDLEVDDFGVRATLSFGRMPQKTVVPWAAVYVVASDDGRGVLYDEDVPTDVSIIPSRSGGEPERVEEEPDRPAPRRTSSGLRSVPLDGPRGDKPEPEPPSPSKRPQLRLVK